MPLPTCDHTGDSNINKAVSHYVGNLMLTSQAKYLENSLEFFSVDCLM